MGDMIEEIELSLKVLVVGNGGVGKTSLIQRFAKDTYTDEYKKTIGVDFLEKQFFSPSLGDNVKMMLWDTAGQEEQFSITRNYFKGAGAAVLAFSTTDRASFDSIDTWRQKVEGECGTDIAMVIMQNKVDLIDKAVMTKQEAEDLASKHGLRLYRVSVKDNLNVNEQQYVKNRKTEAPETTQKVGNFGPKKAADPKDGPFQLQGKSDQEPKKKKKSGC